MTGVAEQTGNWLASFPAAGRAAQPWLQAIRDAAFARFSALGFPTRHDEEWRFTSVAPIARTNWVPAPPAAAEAPAFATGIRLAFVNGRFSAELSDLAGLPKGVRVSRISDDLAAAEPYLAKYAAFDTQAFVQKMRELGATRHVAQNTSGRRSAIDGRTTRHPGYEVSQRVRKRVEEIFGWVKAAAGMRKTKYRGVRKVGWMFTLAAAAYNLVRMRNLGVAAC